MALFQLRTGQKAVTMAGTRVPLTTGSIAARRLVVHANAANVGAIFLGDVTVDDETGIVLAADDEYVFPVREGASPEEDHAYDTSKIYIDAANDADGVYFSFFEPGH